MNRNVEVKARLTNLAETQAKLEELTDAPCEVLAQHDTFFQCQTGRLKLRVFGDGSGELICYQRPDTMQAKTSHYLISQAKDPAELHAVLASALGVVGEVRKTRLLGIRNEELVHCAYVDLHPKIA